jgi:hypothetical protein
MASDIKTRDTMTRDTSTGETESEITRKIGARIGGPWDQRY